jgi:hypothetical protein
MKTTVMKKPLPLPLLCGFLLWVASADGQLEVSRLSTKGYSGVGIGAFINTGFIINRADVLTSEGGFVFYHGLTTTPLPLIGYRHTFNGSGTGWYIEPQLGYTLIASDLLPADSLKLPPGEKLSYDHPLTSGFNTGFALGYIFPGRLGLNLGARYEHFFMTGGNPEVNELSLRLTHTIICGGRRTAAPERSRL